MKNTDDAKKVFFNIDGKPAFDLLKHVHENHIKKIMLIFGPEGGLTEEEITLLKSDNFEFYALTPTVLRSVEAVAVGLGSLRSVG